MWKKIDKYYQTLRYLKISQMKYLALNRLERGQKANTNLTAPSYGELHLWMPGLDEDAAYQMRFDLEEILAGKVTLLHESGMPGRKNWANPEKSHLWNFNLHYLEFLIPLAAACRKEKDSRYYECFRKYCLSWMEDNREGTGDGWHPYTISLRLTNLWICMDGFGEMLREDTEFFGKLNDSMYAQYRHLQKKLERHLLGNHYLENLRAVLLGALYFKEPGVYDKYKLLLQEEIQEQILPDGVHYERSIMYHKIILEDLMRTAKAVCTTDAELYKELLEIIQKMADAMWSLEDGMGHTPLFNDSGDNVARPMSSLRAALLEEFEITPVEQSRFEQAGYYILQNPEMKIVMDAGEIAPDYMPGHGHCDGLSFELSRKGRPVFVNAGTGQYQGNLRSYFRSTAAHNTVVVDGQEQSQCWGEHRVARRIHDVRGNAFDNQIEGTLTTWCGKAHQRSLQLAEDQLQIRDQISGHAQMYLHLAPEFHYVEQEGSLQIADASGSVLGEIFYPKTDQVQVHREGTICSYAPEFGKIQHMEVLELSWDADGSTHEVIIKFI